MFILPAIGVTALGVERHLLLVSYYGLQASHVAVGMITLAVAAVMFWNRIWVATRLAGLHTPGEAIGRYYNSIALRVIMMGLCILFALPYSANLLSQAALLVHQATDGTIPREMAVWVFALSMAVPAIIGGWRAVVMVLAMEALLMAILIPGIMIFGEIVLSGDFFPTRPMPVKDGIIWDQIPGVLQGYAGVGKNVPTGGIFTTVAISSTAISLAGIVLSPATLYLGQTARRGPAFGISAVWLTGGLAAGILLLVVPVLAARMPAGLVAHAEALAAVVPLAGVSVILLGVMGALFAITFFVTGGALLVFRELVHTYLFPNLTDQGQRLGARISLGVGFFLLGLMAAFMPFVSAVFASVCGSAPRITAAARDGRFCLHAVDKPWRGPGGDCSGVPPCCVHRTARSNFLRRFVHRSALGPLAADHSFGRLGFGDKSADCILVFCGNAQRTRNVSKVTFS